MSDISTGGDATTEAAPAPTAPAAAPAAATPAPAGTDDLGKFGEHANYIKELRAEAAKYRTSAKPYEDVFGKYADEDRAVWFDLAKTLAEDPNAGVEKLAQLTENLRKQYPGEQAKPEPAPDDVPKTREDLDKYLADRDSKAQAVAAQEKAVKDVVEAVSKAFAPGTPEHREVLWIAANETNGDIDAAIAKQQEREQAIVDRYLTGKQRPSPKPVTATGEAGEAKAIKSFDDARAALKARLAAKPAE